MYNPSRLYLVPHAAIPLPRIPIWKTRWTVFVHRFVSSARVKTESLPSGSPGLSLLKQSLGLLLVGGAELAIGFFSGVTLGIFLVLLLFLPDLGLLPAFVFPTTQIY